jgi:hypothetical protein
MYQRPVADAPAPAAALAIEFRNQVLARRTAGLVRAGLSTSMARGN